jgi:biopolymer transport protein ExbD
MDSGGEGDDINSTINTTPLVDIMLVLLIIFLITIPVVTKSVPVTMPTATNIVTVTKPENITIAVDREGNVYWNDVALSGSEELFDKLKAVAVLVPQPEVHIRGDKEARFEHIGRVMYNLNRAAIQKVGFITNPAPKVF